MVYFLFSPENITERVIREKERESIKYMYTSTRNRELHFFAQAQMIIDEKKKKKQQQT
jgi:hypothetical protein